MTNKENPTSINERYEFPQTLTPQSVQTLQNRVGEVAIPIEEGMLAWSIIGIGKSQPSKIVVQAPDGYGTECKSYDLQTGNLIEEVKDPIQPTTAAETGSYISNKVSTALEF
ncbi:MAG: hypothetical protein PHP74_02400 [Candidatus Gracilibacteria bacterium]|nr:hypothetical protein [Candidatus Gracilibacteria bacterium]